MCSVEIEGCLYQQSCFFISGHSGCSLNDEQKWCLRVKGIIAMAEGFCTGNDCHTVFQTMTKVAKGGCDISLEFLCDKDLCPENHKTKTCILHDKGL